MLHGAECKFDWGYVYVLKGFFGLILLFLPTLLFAKSTFMVAPTSAKVSLERPSTVSFVVTNNGDAKVRVKIDPIYFPVDSKFMPSAKPLDPKNKTADDLTSFMTISPKVVSVDPGDQRTVRVSVRPKAGSFKEGEYRGHVLFAMLDVGDVMETKGTKGKEGVSMKIAFKSETAVVFYGEVGKGSANLKTKCELLKNGKTKIDITNAGKWRFDGWLRIMDGNKKLTEDKVFIVRESIRNTVLNWAPKDITQPVKITWVPLDEAKKPFTTQCLMSKNDK